MRNFKMDEKLIFGKNQLIEYQSFYLLNLKCIHENFVIERSHPLWEKGFDVILQFNFRINKIVSII